jgi:esterase/lipase superfamily enzyme
VALHEMLQRVREESPDAFAVLIAHSHGANIVLHALARLPPSPLTQARLKPGTTPARGSGTTVW